MLVAAIILFPAGCSLEYNLKFDMQLPLPPVVKQLPLRVGVYYTPEFVEYIKKVELTGCGPSGRRDKTGIFFIFPVGTASQDLFDQIISSMFTTVISTSNPPQSLDKVLPIDGLLEPRIESFDWDTVCSDDYFSKWKSKTRVSYLINLYDSLDGSLVTSMYIEGQSTVLKPKLCFMFKDCNESLGVAQAIQDAMAKFMIDFHEQSEVGRWLSAHLPASGDRQRLH